MVNFVQERQTIVNFLSYKIVQYMGQNWNKNINICGATENKTYLLNDKTLPSVTPSIYYFDNNKIQYLKMNSYFQSGTEFHHEYMRNNRLVFFILIILFKSKQQGDF